MAQATHTPAVTRTEVVEIQPEGIALQLSMEEAGALLAVSRRIGGSAATRRRHFDSIRIELCKAGVTDPHHGNDVDKVSRSIYFTETSL